MTQHPTTDRLLRLPSRHLPRPVHLWCHGHAGTPVLVMPSASGLAHEWQLGGAVEALRPWLDAGHFRLYCVESNVSRSWLAEGPAAPRYVRHLRYRRFLDSELLPFIEQDSGHSGQMVVAGASFGAFLALNAALQAPERFAAALCLSGRFRVWPFFEDAALHGPEHHQDAHIQGILDEARRAFQSREGLQAGTHYDRPFAYVPGLTGHDLHRARSVDLTLVVGQGPHEGRCLPETRQMAGVLASRGLRATLDVWGHDVSHEWVWWRRQLAFHLPRLARRSHARAS